MEKIELEVNGPNTDLNAAIKERFQSAEDLIKDATFISKMYANIKSAIRERNDRPEPKQGFIYKKDWYDRMKAAGEMKAEFFLENIESVWNKTSNLSSEKRRVIEYFGNKAFSETIAEIFSEVKPAEEI